MVQPLVLTCAQSRLVDRLAIDEYGIPGVVLMENAGRGAVDVLLELDPGLTRTPAGSVAILCGKGNNAGDGFVIARHLDLRGVAATVLCISPPSDLTGDALTNYQILARSGAHVVDLSAAAAADPGSLPPRLDACAGDAAWLVDALLGTGVAGAPREPLRTAIEWMNSRPARRLAVDLPSGLDGDTGEVRGVAVRADATCTFVAAKPGLLTSAAAPWVGDLRIVAIGVPRRLLAEVLQRG
jgi:NAD(P)H-hydrate epimerase